MKKRIMALALAAVMSLSLSVTAFAASPDKSTASSTQDAASSEAEIIDVTGKGLDDNVELSTEANNALLTAVNNLKSSGVSILYTATKNLTAAGTYTWTLGVPDSAIGKAAIVYHYHDGAWTRQIVTVSAAKTITVTFKSASPVNISVTDKTVAELTAQGVSNTEPGTTSSDNSPKTGENNLALLLALMACVSGGALVATKKSR